MPPDCPTIVDRASAGYDRNMKNSHRSTETCARISNGQKAAWARRNAASYRLAASTARILLYSESPDQALLRTAVKQALALAPDEFRPSWQRVSDALAAGRRFKHSSFPVTFRLPVDGELVADLESAFL